VRVVLIEDGGGELRAAQMLGVVGITRSLLDALTEDEVAFVLGHEYAHLALGHGHFRARAKQAEGKPLPAGAQSMFEGVGNPPHEQTPREPLDQEADADAMGLLFAMRGGYEAQGAQKFFESVRTRGATWKHAGTATHPATADRSATLRKLAVKLCADVTNGRPLILQEERLLPPSDYRREEAIAAPLPAVNCTGV